MTDRILALFALIVLAGFLGVLLWKVQRIDLAIVIGITYVLAVWDFLTTKPTPLRGK